ncbi:HEXXH motif-containing putative peptide modification protein [bacterium]|nr:HEXXH motif-containing putative peptide modification protein [bacterium]
MYSLLFDLDQTQKLAREYWQALRSETMSELNIELNEELSVFDKSIIWSMGTYRPETLSEIKDSESLKAQLIGENEYIHNYQLNSAPSFIKRYSMDLEQGLHYDLDEALLKEVEGAIERALEIVKTHWHEAYEEIEAIYKAFVWQRSPGLNNRAHSAPQNFGFSFLNIDYFKDVEPVALATQFVHEASHQILFVECAIDPLIPEDYDTMVYSPFRGEQRPAIGALHALISMARMLMWKEKLENHLDYEKECKDIERLIPLYNQAIEELASIKFSQRGNDLMDSFKRLQTTL